MVKNLIGPPVTGANFYGRTSELEEALSLMEQGNIVFRSPVIRQYWFNKFVR